jgi:hypothetical protein
LIDERPADDSAAVRGNVEVRFGVQVQLLQQKRTVWLFQNPALVTVGALLAQYATQFGVSPDDVRAKQADQPVSAEANLVDLKSDTPIVIEGLESAPAGDGLRFLLPDGTVLTRQFDDTRTFASLVGEFPDLPDIQFFDGDAEIDQSARVSSLTGRGLIGVRIDY